MPSKNPPDRPPYPGKLLQHEGEDGYVYDDWALTACSREKMIEKWPDLDLTWVDLAAKEFASAWAAKGSNKDGFVGWREDVRSVSFASGKLLKALEGCAFPAQHTLGNVKTEHTWIRLYDHAVAVITALKANADQIVAATKNVDARSLSQPMPDLIIKLASQLRYSGLPWDQKFKVALVSLTTMTLDGLELRHGLDIRSSVKDALKSGDQRLNKLR